jgi:hypothetical protein
MSLSGIGRGGENAYELSGGTSTTLKVSPQSTGIYALKGTSSDRDGGGGDPAYAGRDRITSYGFTLSPRTDDPSSFGAIGKTTKGGSDSYN